MKLKSCLSLLLAIFLTLSISNAQQLSDQSEFAVVTLGPYQGELYSAFGHSAFHIKDPANRIDLIYNYGIFDFDQENFYWNFSRGIMRYKLGVSRAPRFFQFYKSQNRFIKRQVLDLTTEQKQQIFEFLKNNAKPENREYLYNYVYDNCATKMYTVVRDLYGPEISFDSSYVESGVTIRDLMDRYLAHQYWGDFLIDLGLGVGVDKEASGEEYMFLPDYVFESYAKSTIKDSVGVKPLVLKTENIFLPKEEVNERPILTPLNWFIIMFFLFGFLTNRSFKKGKRGKWVDSFLFGITGVVGLFLLFLWFGTVHISWQNFNLIWALPTHIIVVFFVNKEKYRLFIRKYFLGTAIIYGLLILTWSFLPQTIHMALVPWVLLLLLRALYIAYDLRKPKTA
ncbi:MAG: DUF4105 domain-containing protein [bacterium]|nr:DUF4105 domain-containing protein [bacterium]